LKIARVYDSPEADEGLRVLVDRLWPRGFRRDDPRVGIWRKELAPSTELREWYRHQAERFDEFAARYRIELNTARSEAAIAELRSLSASGPIVLVTATKELSVSHLGVLAEVLTSR
jgi:uncharacterized protein YeaO (DUF488 family)